MAAFGAFSGKTLDFSASPGALSVVYGHNEAGKSTSLRAYEGLLFGIDSTADAFLHGTKKLRVGGRFCSDAGEELTVYRRRGKKDTLVDANDQPLDESKLKKLLRGVDRDLFAALYGLDHVRLREGKKALFAEGSSVAEGLFEASLSG
ncbi:MAG: AAA family ATPase, partial [Myxococcales bacterium]|nr:AAA family ATPase [Myxococcales bacterium]